MEKESHGKLGPIVGLVVQDITTDTTTSGAIIDTGLFESCTWWVRSGTITDGTYTGAIWESDDSGMSGATVVSAAETLGAAAYVAADDDENRKIGSVGKKRYQQLRIVSASTSSGGTNFVACAILGDHRHGPVANVP